MIANIKIHFCLIYILITVFLAPTETGAQTYFYTSGSGTYTQFYQTSSPSSRHDVLHWESAVTIPWYLNSDGAGDGLTFNQTQSAVDAAFDAWQNVATAYIGFTHAGSIASRHSNSDNKNVIFWAETGDQGFTTGYYGTVMDQAILALTIITVNSNQELLDVDIAFNGKDQTWALDPFEDIQSIATHEIGHLLGLGHFPFANPVPTMHSSPTEPGARTLEQADMDGATFLYRQTLDVPADFSTISAALTDAVSGSGQVIAVASGSHNVSSDLTVKSGNTLQVNSGSTTLNFTGNYKLRVEGKLVASGTTFTRSGGQWYGIEFYNGSSESSISYSTIQNAQYGVYTYGTFVSISDCSIKNNTTGVYVYNNSTTLSHNLVQDNTYGGCFRVS